MLTDNDHLPLTCADLSLDPERIDTAYTDATNEILQYLSHHFGRVLVRTAFQQGLQADLREALRAFAQSIANEISAAYTTEALRRSREATSNMFEALAVGAHVTHRAVKAGESTAELAGALATIAAIEGRPHILHLENEERSRQDQSTPLETDQS